MEFLAGSVGIHSRKPDLYDSRVYPSLIGTFIAWNLVVLSAIGLDIIQNWMTACKGCCSSVQFKLAEFSELWAVRDIWQAKPPGWDQFLNLLIGRPLFKCGPPAFWVVLLSYSHLLKKNPLVYRGI